MTLANVKELWNSIVENKSATPFQVMYEGKLYTAGSEELRRAVNGPNTFSTLPKAPAH